MLLWSVYSNIEQRAARSTPVSLYCSVSQNYTSTIIIRVFHYNYRYVFKSQCNRPQSGCCRIFGFVVYFFFLPFLSCLFVLFILVPKYLNRTTTITTKINLKSKMTAWLRFLLLSLLCCGPPQLDSRPQTRGWCHLGLGVTATANYKIRHFNVKIVCVLDISRFGLKNYMECRANR